MVAVGRLSRPLAHTGVRLHLGRRGPPGRPRVVSHVALLAAARVDQVAVVASTGDNAHRAAVRDPLLVRVVLRATEGVVAARERRLPHATGRCYRRWRWRRQGRVEEDEGVANRVRARGARSGGEAVQEPR